MPNKMNSNILLIANEAGVANNTSYAVQTEVFLVFCVQLGNSEIIHLQNNSVEDFDLTDIKDFGGSITPESLNHYF